MINAQDSEVFFHVFRYLFFFLPYSLSYFFTLHGEQWCGLMIDQSDLLGVPSNKLPQKKKKRHILSGGASSEPNFPQDQGKLCLTPGLIDCWYTSSGLLFPSQTTLKLMPWHAAQPTALVTPFCHFVRFRENGWPCFIGSFWLALALRPLHDMMHETISPTSC